MPDAPAVSPVAEGTVPWPADAARQYVVRGWWRGLALGTELWTAANARLDAPAVIDGELRLTYRSVTARADALAARLTDGLGLHRGDRIVVQLPNCWQFVVLLLGCLRAGVIPVMALPAHRRHELAYLVDHSEAAAIAVPGEHARLRPPAVGGRPGRRLPDVARRADDERDCPSREHRSHRPVCRAPRCGSRPARGGMPIRPAAATSRCSCCPAAPPACPSSSRAPTTTTPTTPAPAPGCAGSAGHGVPGHAARLAQLPAGLPRHPRHPAGRRPRRHAALAGAGAGLRRHRRRGRHRHRRRSRGRAALAPARRRARRRPAAHALACCRSAARGLPTRSPARSGRSWVPPCSRCSAWPKGC